MTSVHVRYLTGWQAPPHKVYDVSILENGAKVEGALMVITEANNVRNITQVTMVPEDMNGSPADLTNGQQALIFRAMAEFNIQGPTQTIIPDQTKKLPSSVRLYQVYTNHLNALFDEKVHTAIKFEFDKSILKASFPFKTLPLTLKEFCNQHILTPLTIQSNPIMEVEVELE